MSYRLLWGDINFCNFFHTHLTIFLISLANICNFLKPNREMIVDVRFCIITKL